MGAFESGISQMSPFHSMYNSYTKYGSFRFWDPPDRISAGPAAYQRQRCAGQVGHWSL